VSGLEPALHVLIVGQSPGVILVWPAGTVSRIRRPCPFVSAELSSRIPFVARFVYSRLFIVKNIGVGGRIATPRIAWSVRKEQKPATVLIAAIPKIGSNPSVRWIEQKRWKVLTRGGSAIEDVSRIEVAKYPVELGQIDIRNPLVAAYQEHILIVCGQRILGKIGGSRAHQRIF
jgi:hypothetical protein